MAGHDLLVGGRQVFTQLDAPDDVVERGVLTAHRLDDDVNVGVVDDGLDIGRDQISRDIERACLAWVSQQDPLQREGTANDASQQVPLFE